MVRPSSLLTFTRDQSLAAVVVEVQRLHPGAAEVAEADRVAQADRLDLDDVGAEVAEDHGGKGAGHDLTQVEHAHTVERTGHRDGFPPIPGARRHRGVHQCRRC